MCAPDTNECTTDVTGECPDGGAEACHTVTPGAACQVPNAGAGYCNPDGVCRDCMQCSEASCENRCNGQICATTNDCKSGYCQESTCCNNECVGPCRVCNWPDIPGTCTRYPNGMQPVGCVGGMICDTQGECVGRVKAALGMTCSGNNVCHSGVCRAQMCRSVIGEPCVDHAECTSNFCDPNTKTCKLCTDSMVGPCPSGTKCLATGWCEALPGQPADSGAECVPGADAYNYLCGFPVGASCTAHEQCIYRHCSPVTGKCLDHCNAVSCANGFACDPTGSCRLKSGSYCVNEWQCQSQKCTGFPRRCQ